MVNKITWMKTNLWKTVYSHVDRPTLHIQAAPKGILFCFFLLKKAQEVEKESVVLRSEQERRELDLIKLDYIHIINHQRLKVKAHSDTPIDFIPFVHIIQKNLYTFFRESIISLSIPIFIYETGITMHTLYSSWISVRSDGNWKNFWK